MYTRLTFIFSLFMSAMCEFGSKRYQLLGITEMKNLDRTFWIITLNMKVFLRLHLACGQREAHEVDSICAKIMAFCDVAPCNFVDRY